MTLKGEDDVWRQNLVANLMDAAMFAFGMSFVSLQTVLPVFVKRIGGSSFAVALIPVLWTAGFNFPQIFIANYVQRFPYKKRLFLKTALVQRVPWLLLALLTFFVIDQVGPSGGAVLFLSLFTVAAVAGSVNFPIWFDLIAKLTPVGVRGRLFAARNLLGGVLGVIGGWVVIRILDRIAYPTSYGVLFILAFSAMMISYAGLLLLREETPSTVAEQIHFVDYYRRLPGILKQKNFRNFLISDALLIAATMAGAFYAVHAIQRFQLTDAVVGVFTSVMMGSMIIGNIFFGLLADRYGHKLNLVLSAASTAVACFAALVAPSLEVYLIVFVGSAFQMGLSGISRFSIVAELCTEQERPTYVALTNMVTSPFVVFGVLAGGIAGRYGYEAVFVIGGLLALSSALWLAFKVEEPRNKAAVPLVQSVQY
jgi:MFS family permease